MSNEMEIIAYHEAGHCVAARVLGLEIGDEGCSIREMNDEGSQVYGSSDVRISDPRCPPQDVMVFTIAGSIAGYEREAELMVLRRESSEEILSAACARSAETMLIGDIGDVVDLLGELTGHRCANTDKAKEILAHIVGLAGAGLTRKNINARLGTDDSVICDEWYVPLRQAVDKSSSLVREHWRVVGTLALRLLSDRQMSGDQVRAFLDVEKCPTPPAKPRRWLTGNPFIKPHNP